MDKRRLKKQPKYTEEQKAIRKELLNKANALIWSVLRDTNGIPLSERACSLLSQTFQGEQKVVVEIGGELITEQRRLTDFPSSKLTMKDLDNGMVFEMGIVARNLEGNAFQLVLNASTDKKRYNIQSL